MRGANVELAAWTIVGESETRGGKLLKQKCSVKLGRPRKGTNLGQMEDRRGKREAKNRVGTGRFFGQKRKERNGGHLGATIRMEPNPDSARIEPYQEVAVWGTALEQHRAKSGTHMRDKYIINQHGESL